MSIIVNKIAELRKKKHLGQAEMALRMGIGRTALSDIENCKYMPSAKTMKIVSDIFQLPLGDIFFNPDVLRDNTN